MKLNQQVDGQHDDALSPYFSQKILFLFFLGVHDHSVNYHLGDALLGAYRDKVGHVKRVASWNYSMG